MTAIHLETDASLNPARTRDGLTFAGGGIVLRTAEMAPVGAYSAPLGYVASATHAEFLTILQGAAIARERHGATSLRVRADNLSLVRAVRGEVEFHDASLVVLVGKVREIAEGFERFEIRWSPSSHRKTRLDGLPTADSLARKAAGLEIR